MLTIIVLVLVVLGLAVSVRLWPTRINPIFIGIVVWTPGLVMATVPREFVSPLYAHLNHEIGWGVALALLLGFIYFTAGVLTAGALTGRERWSDRLRTHQLALSDARLLLVYGIGLVVFLYSFARSGLTDVVSLDPEEVAESRLRLHLGALSFLVLFLDIGAILFMARLLETRRLVYAWPVAIAVLCQMATLQKSRMLFLVLGSIYLMLLQPDAARSIALGTSRRKLVTTLSAGLLFASLFVMNALRGIGVIQMTEFKSPLFEQIYIYSGATAILDLSSAIEGLVPTDPPRLGLLLARPITWHLVDRQLLNPTVHFEGINAATYLIYPWADFRWIGFIVSPFLTGLLVTVYLAMSMRRTAHGIVFGVIGFQALIFSINTDVVFDPTTLIVMILTLAVSAFVRPWRGRRADPSIVAGMPTGSTQ